MFVGLEPHENCSYLRIINPSLIEIICTNLAI